MKITLATCILLAVLSESIGESPQAIDSLARRLESKSVLVAEDRVLLAALYHHLGNPQQAAKTLEESPGLMEGRGSSPVERQLYAECLLEIGRHADAIGILKAIDAEHAANARVVYLIGVTYLRAGDLSQGMSYLERAAEQGYSPAHLELAAWVADPGKKRHHLRQVILLEEEGSILAEKAAKSLNLESDQ